MVTSQQPNKEPIAIIFGTRSISSLKRLEPLYRRLFDSRWTVAVLIALGVARAALFLLSYAPADGADAADYYAYAAYIAGVDVSSRAAVVSPIFPIFVYLTHYAAGTIELAVIIQVILSASIGLVLYLGLRRYSPLLGFLTGLIALGDAQVGVLSNFTATEPLYIFLLCAMFALALASYRGDGALWKPVLLGIVLFLLTETRTVGTYLWYPVIGLYAVYLRDVKRIVLATGTVIGAILVFSVIMTTLGIQQTSTTNMLMYSRSLIQFDLLQADAGPASQELATLVNQCEAQDTDLRLSACIEAELGSEIAVGNLFRTAYLELWRAMPQIMIREARIALYNYLRMSGQQYEGEPTPATVQCRDVNERAEGIADYILNVEWGSAGLSPAQESAFRDVMLDFSQQFCPPWPESDAARTITDSLAQFYRFLSPQNPYLLHGILVSMLLAFGWARKYWYPYLLATGIWLYHAAISAALLNVQPRYVVVTNPMRAVYVALFIFLLLQLFVRMYVAARRTLSKPSA